MSREPANKTATLQRIDRIAKRIRGGGRRVRLDDLEELRRLVAVAVQNGWKREA